MTVMPHSMLRFGAPLGIGTYRSCQDAVFSYRGAAVSRSASRRDSTGMRSSTGAGYDEHGVIVGWSADPEAKDERLARQADLASAVLLENVKLPPAAPAAT